MEPQSFLEGKTITLRPLNLDDLKGNYVNWFNDSEVCQFNSHHAFPYIRELASEYISDLQGKKNNLVLAIVAKDSGKHIGNVSLQNISYINRNAEYAIILGERDYWGKGIAKEASALIIKHGFEALNLHRIYCGTSVKNTAMQKLAAALGMQEEGRRREDLYKDGEYVDIVEYGLLKKDFKLE